MEQVLRVFDSNIQCYRTAIVLDTIDIRAKAMELESDLIKALQSAFQLQNVRLYRKLHLMSKSLQSMLTGIDEQILCGTLRFLMADRVAVLGRS
ncbi:hypothetical protein Ddye_009365 [Dipteronia dyeriana]|uniref:Uncharacterized protein n=1 Tax=Dipteronia dyeriana TaxID=168575 RepID=A0AAD9XBH0_9ROSI|nr:hypothetical protein Ddye_009365 [Dipteronia dyeriana]